MPKVTKIGSTKFLNFTKNDLNRIPSPVGRNKNILAPQGMIIHSTLGSILNRSSLGALNNYAKYNNVSIYLTPLEGNLFADLNVQVYRNSLHSDTKPSSFDIKLEDDQEAGDFMRTLYTKVAECVNKSSIKK